MKYLREYAGRYNDLARIMLKDCCEGAEGENVLISPLSLLLAMAMAADGAEGETREEIIRLLGDEDAGKVLGGMQKGLAPEQTSAANAVCVRDIYAAGIRAGYRELLRGTYDGEIFSSSGMAADVNRWVAEKTRGMIRNAAPEGLDDAVLCLLNAIAFEGRWEKQYPDDCIADMDFTNADGTAVKVSMLQSTERKYVSGHGFTGFIRDYEGDAFSFMALLPKKRGNAELAAALRRADFSSLYRNWENARVVTRMPEFSFEYTGEMSGLFRRHGVNQAFMDAADFSPMISVAVKIGMILHKAYIDVNREGTRAASMTEIAMPRATGIRPQQDPVRYVYLDRPFAFAIMDRSSGLPVFTGVMNQMKEKN